MLKLGRLDKTDLDEIRALAQKYPEDFNFEVQSCWRILITWKASRRICWRIIAGNMSGGWSWRAVAVYQVFSFKGKIEHLNARELEEIGFEVEQMDAFNDDRFREKSDQRTAMLSYARAIWGEASKAYKAIQRQVIPEPPDNMKELAKLERKYQKWSDAEKKRQKQRAYRRQYRQRQDEAMERLTEMGYVFGQDFGRSNAISFLKDAESIPEPAFPMTEH